MTLLYGKLYSVNGISLFAGVARKCPLLHDDRLAPTKIPKHTAYPAMSSLMFWQAPRVGHRPE